MKNFSAPVLTFFAFLAVSVDAGNITEKCRQETKHLQGNPRVQSAYKNATSIYLADYKQVCHFGKLEDVKLETCSLKFTHNKTATAHLMFVCRNAGGQIYEQQGVFLHCGKRLATGTFNLGSIPLCVGNSCNVSNINKTDFENVTTVKQIINRLEPELGYTACQKELSSGADSPLHVFRSLFAALLVGIFGYTAL